MDSSLFFAEFDLWDESSNEKPAKKKKMTLGRCLRLIKRMARRRDARGVERVMRECWRWETEELVPALMVTASGAVMRALLGAAPGLALSPVAHEALLAALREGREGAAIALLATSPPTLTEVETPGPDQSPLYVACARGRMASVRALLRGGDRADFAALHLAAAGGHSGAVRALLERDNVAADVRCPEGYTALHWAADRAHPACIRALLDHGADPDARDSDGDTALHHVATRPCLHMDAERPFYKWRDVPARDRVRCAEALLSAGAHPDATDCDDSTPLFLAIDHNHLQLVLYLINEGNVNVQHRGADGMTALHCAALSGLVPVMERLVTAGLAVNSQRADGQTPLHLAVQTHQEDASSELLRLGADARLRDCYGRTALHLAAENWFESGVRLLLNAAGTRDVGAALQDADHQGRTVLHLVAHWNAGLLEEIATLGGSVHARDCRGRTPLHFAARLSNAEAAASAEALVRLGVDLHARDLFGQTALHHAAAWGADDIVRFLLLRGADKRARDVLGRTPLHLSVAQNSDSCMRLLLGWRSNAHATPKRATAGDTTPLHPALNLHSI